MFLCNCVSLETFGCTRAFKKGSSCVVIQGSNFKQSVTVVGEKFGANGQVKMRENETRYMDRNILAFSYKLIKMTEQFD